MNPELELRGADEMTKHTPEYKCPYCGGPSRCPKCDITCKDAGGLLEDGLCVSCWLKLPVDARAASINKQEY